jgi:ferredoxin
MKATIDDDLCRGHGVCVTLCPEVFRMTDDGYAVAVESEVPAHLEAAVIDAVASCPEHAITADWSRSATSQLKGESKCTKAQKGMSF